jgi:hypothetical protein
MTEVQKKLLEQVIQNLDTAVSEAEAAAAKCGCGGDDKYPFIYGFLQKRIQVQAINLKAIFHTV